MAWKNYIWDFDGTLFNTYPVMLEALREAMKQSSVEFPGDLEAYIKRFSIRKFDSLLSLQTMTFLICIIK